MKYNNVIFIIVTIVIILLSLIYINTAMQTFRLTMICKSNGYNSFVNDLHIEPGYVKCCNEYYLNHELITGCQIIKS
jgi:hypothetical protein